MELTLKEAAAACGGTLCDAEGREEERVSCAVIDSRKIEAGGLFFASKGEKTDGHGFIGQVFERGAACVVTEKTPEETERICGVPREKWGPYILVENSLQALKRIAAYYRSRLDIPVIGITGSVGKTSTKEFVAGVLSEKYKVLKTEGNYNNEIGLPLTLLRIRSEHEAAVVEMGISDFGEMSRLGEMARPDICVITNIGQCHLENLRSRQGILKAKTEIFDYLRKGGRVCLNGEDDLLFAIKEVNGEKVCHFGVSENRDFSVYATDVENLGLQGSRALMHIGEAVYPVEIPLPGTHMVINAMAAAAVGLLLGMTPEEIRTGIGKVQPVGGRSRLIRQNGICIIDDCYNANPVSVKAALDLLMTAKDRKIAILGDMFELGEEEERLHAEVGAYAVEQGVDALYCVGSRSRFMYDAAMEGYDGSQDIRYFETKEELLEILSELLEEGDTVLVKASHGMGFSVIVDSLRS